MYVKIDIIFLGGAYMKEHILIIEDEKAIQDVLYDLLTDAGYEVSLASDGLEGLSFFQSQSFALILLDIMMPKIDGYAVCELIRKESDIPIIMLTAMDEEEAQIRAFELQVDDYITKPFSLKLVLMRIEAVLRRIREKTGNQKILSSHGIELNVDNYEVYKNGIPIKLTQLEFELLTTFLKHKNQVLTRDNLISQVWGYDFAGDEKTVNIHIMNLRRKLDVDCIQTIRGVGYKFESEN